MVAISQSVWHFMKEVNMLQPNQKITALYCRLSRDCLLYTSDAADE